MPSASRIAQSVQDYISELTKPKSLEEITKEYPPEELAMQFGPGGLAGVFRSNVVNKLLKDAAAHPEAGPVSKNVLHGLIGWLKEMPTSVMERVGSFNVRPQVVDPMTAAPVGGYYARAGVIPKAIMDPYVPGTPLPQGKNIQPGINISGAGQAYGQYPHQYTGLPETATKTEHEFLHALLDAVWGKEGSGAYKQLRSKGRGAMTHGPEEPFASSKFSPSELEELVKPHLFGLSATKELGAPDPIAKAIIRAMKQGKISEESTLPGLLRMPEEYTTHTGRNLAQLRELREALARQKGKKELLIKIQEDLDRAIAKGDKYYEKIFRDQLERAKRGKSKLMEGPQWKPGTDWP